MEQESPFGNLVEMPEHQLVEAVFADQLLIQHVGVPPLMSGVIDYRLRVTPVQLGLPPESFGDADAILLHAGDHATARAVEFKRVKISADGLERGVLNKLSGLARSAHQASALHAAGFAIVWITVIVVADMRPVTRGTGFAAPPASLIRTVDEALPLGTLTPGIGVTVCEITQVSDRPANERGAAGGRILRLADQQAQPQELTEGIAALFA